MKIKNLFALVAVMVFGVVLVGCGDFMSQNKTLTGVLIHGDTKKTYNVGESLDLSRTYVNLTYTLSGDVTGAITPKYDLSTNTDNLDIVVVPTMFTAEGSNIKVTIKLAGTGNISGTKEVGFYVNVLIE